MADLSRMRKRFTVMAGVLGGIAAIATLYLVLPFGQTSAELYKDLGDTRDEFKRKEVQVRPLRGLPDKLVTTHGDINDFYRDRLPARQSVVSEEIGKIATANHVTLSDVKYDNVETDIPDLREVIVDAQLSGDYANVAKFINAVERNKTFFMVDGLTLDEQKAGAVRLQLKMETYLRPSNIQGAPEKPAGKTPKAGNAKTGD
jgi:type IV pilus assembly protein PilO